MSHMQNLTSTEVCIRLLCSVFAGALVGIERQYRSRRAGLRTNTLVSAGACMFVLLSSFGFDNLGGTADPTRVAAQIVSGIGFLGAGVIMRDGFSVRGLNTAATLWCSAALGALSGSGLFHVVFFSTVVVLFINVILRKLASAIDKRPLRDVEQALLYAVQISTKRKHQAKIRATLVQSISQDKKLHLVAISTHAQDYEDDDRVLPTECTSLVADIYSDKKNDESIESLCHFLSLDTNIISLEWNIKKTYNPEDDESLLGKTFLRSRKS